MPVHDFRAQRLFVDADLAEAARIPCTRDQANYLRNVLRLGNGDSILIFNGRDGEWRAVVETAGRRDCSLTVAAQTRQQAEGPDIHYLFAPLKRARLDYMVQKVTELGVARIVPVITHRTIADRVNLDRMRANIIEAAEQCGILHLPLLDEPVKLTAVLERWPSDRKLIFADEAAEAASPLDALLGVAPGSPCAVLVGPEGGFSEAERERILRGSEVLPISLGPRIMRADTAAVAVLSMVNATIGDWRV